MVGLFYFNSEKSVRDLPKSKFKEKTRTISDWLERFWYIDSIQIGLDLRLVYKGVQNFLMEIQKQVLEKKKVKVEYENND